MNQRSQTGAARVSAVWMIVVVVLFFVSLAFAYVANQEAQKSKDAAASARSIATEAEAKYDTQLKLSGEISEALGFYDREIVGSTSNVTVSSDSLDGLKQVISMPESVQDWEGTVQPIVDAYQAKDAQIATLTSQVANLTSQLTAAKASQATVSSTLQGQLTQKNQELTDATQTASDEKARLEGDVSNITQARNQVESELNTERGSKDDVVALLERERTAATTRQAALNRQLAILRETTGPDGEILAISKSLNIGWINRGSLDRISRGMRFEVRTGNPNPLIADVSKGMVEVISVEPNKSEVRIVETRDPFDPIVSRDLIFNPLFDPVGDRYAVLLGRFTGAYNEAELRLLLADIGITVQSNVDLTTNYLIVGEPLYYDEEGEAVEDPILPSELPAYKDADSKGVLIVSIRDLQQYFRR